ncbi:provicilin-like [Neltuma alba]|uniref:provicilin-like n=1 Tax=Neltuma alba TaxID=207710 RepID=UPI0010A3FC6A|nr:provicilin-like [Prosopis alba]
MGCFKARLPVLLLLGSVFLAVASVGLAHWEDDENSEYRVCVRNCVVQSDPSVYAQCPAHCRSKKDRHEEKEEAAERDPRLPDPRRPWRPGQTEEGEGEETEEEKPQRQREREQQQQRPHRQPRPGRRPQEEEQEQEEGRHRQPRPGRRPQEEEKEGQEESPQRQSRPGRRPQEGGQGEKQKQQQENPYHVPSDRFQTRFENENGRIRVLQKFDHVSPHLRMLRYYRIVEYRARPGTLIVPHHSDAEYLVINTRGRAIVTLVLPNYKESFNLEQFDVLRVPAGAICYTINRASGQDLELIKLALPVNIPGQIENFYPSGNQIPNSYLKAFNRKTLQAAFNASYEEIEQAFWGTEQQQQQGQQGSEEGVIVKLPREQLRSLISRAQSRQRREEKSSPLGPFNLKNIQPRYSNNHGTLREAHPQRFEALQDLGIGVSHLRLNEGSMFLPHYNTRAIILAFVAEGQGDTEMQRQREGEGEGQEHREGQFKRLAARLSKGDFFIVPAGHPVAVRASRNSNLEVVEFVLNAPYNFRSFLAGKSQNVLNELDREVKEAAFEGSGEQVERLLNRQRESFFVDREEQPSGGGRSPSQTGKVAWSSILTAFM